MRQEVGRTQDHDNQRSSVGLAGAVCAEQPGLCGVDAAALNGTETSSTARVVL